MKQLVQSFLATLGFRLIRLHAPGKYEHNYDGSKFFFPMLKQRGFAPKHIVDIGANHGEWTRTALKYFPDAYYTLVEPQDHLKIHIQDLFGRDGRVRWIGAGAGDKLGTLTLTIGRDDVESTFALTSERAQAEGLRQIEVPVTTLNEIVRTSDAPFPDMVKIDAEGFDLKVLAGASELVGKTDIFLLEAMVCEQTLENTLGNVLEAMAHVGYRAIDHRPQPQPEVRSTLAL
jgi:FkbM family methyltransferase